METTLEPELSHGELYLPAEPLPDQTEIERCLRLFHQPGEVFEVRILFDRNRTSSGYFDDPVLAAKLIADFDRERHPCGTYHTLNPVQPELLLRSPNRITERAWQTTEDINITMRKWVLIDLDPNRESGTNSTEAELNAAIAASEIVREFLRKWGFPEPAHAISGNGLHLYVPAEMPNDESSKIACRSLLKLLARRAEDFNEPDRPQIKIDTSVYNASRIARLSGTIARKGIHTASRPHRMAELTYIPDFLPGGSVKHA